MSLLSLSQTEGMHAAEHIAGPIDINVSNEARTVLSGQNLVAGAVVGSVDLGVGGMVAVLSGTSPGNGTLTEITAGRDIEAGAYLVQCTAIATHGGTFSVTTPSGKRLPDVVMTAGAGTATDYKSTHINFTLTDGSTDFALTALFTITASTTVPVVLGGTGTGTLTAITLGREAKRGGYTVICREAITNGGSFEVIDPDGDSLGTFLMTAGSGTATAFTSPQLNFTLTDATDFIVGNRFHVAVFKLATAGKVVAWDPTLTTYDGHHNVLGVLWDAVDASAGDAPGVVTVRGPVSMVLANLTFAATVPAAEQAAAIAQLKTLGIVAI